MLEVLLLSVFFQRNAEWWLHVAPLCTGSWWYRCCRGYCDSIIINYLIYSRDILSKVNFKMGLLLPWTFTVLVPVYLIVDIHETLCVQSWT